MKKDISILLIIISLIIFVGEDCFSQNSDMRVRALQGEWKWISIQDGNKFLDLNETSNTVEIILKIVGNNFFIVELENETGENIVEAGIFTIFQDLLMTSGKIRQNYLYPYTLMGNILRIVSDGTVITMHKKIENNIKTNIY